MYDETIIINNDNFYNECEFFQIALVDFWRKYRRKYRRICCLVEFINEHISFVIILSVSHNLLHVCVQLLNVMKLS